MRRSAMNQVAVSAVLALALGSLGARLELAGPDGDPVPRPHKPDPEPRPAEQRKLDKAAERRRRKNSQRALAARF